MEDFNYNLPNELIAKSFNKKRENSKLLILKKDQIEHKRFYNIIDYMNKDDVLVLNETKVVKNKLDAQKPTGARAEFIIEKKIKSKKEEQIYQCRIHGSHPKIGNIFEMKDKTKAEIIDADNTGIFIVKFNKDPIQIIKKHGKIPFPFYIKKEIKKEDRYQTEYAKKGESLAAPTAGLHFSKDILKKIKDKGVIIAKVRLDISFETFLKVTDEQIKRNKLHKEYFEISKKTAETINNRKGKLIVCGTTSLRTLESSSKNGKVIPQTTTTDIFIKPGYKSEVNPDLIITNFHLPKSSLLMMISAYIKKDNLLSAYKEAIKKKYRFYSLGDAMLIVR